MSSRDTLLYENHQKCNTSSLVNSTTLRDEQTSIGTCHLERVSWGGMCTQQWCCSHSSHGLEQVTCSTTIAALYPLFSHSLITPLHHYHEYITIIHLSPPRHLPLTHYNSHTYCSWNLFECDTKLITEDMFMEMADAMVCGLKAS